MHGASGLVLLTTAAATWLGLAPANLRLDRRVPRDARRPRGPNLPASTFVEDGRRRGALCAVACSLAGWTWGGIVAAVVGLAAGVLLSAWLGHLEPPSVARDRAIVERDLPLVVDLLAACAEAGLPLQPTLAPIGLAVGGPVGARLRDVSARLDLGADPLREWSRLAEHEAFAGLGRAMMRAHRSGAPVTDVLGRLSADCRRTRRTQSQATARAVGVKVAAPLAACFLPAFMLIGVVPTIVGGLSHLGL